MTSRGDTIDQAIQLRDDASVVERLRQRMPEALGLLDRIACGDVPRNAQASLKAIEVMLRYSQPLPKQTVEHQGAVGLALVDPYALPPGHQDAIEGEATVLPLALPVATPPIIRRKGGEGGGVPRTSAGAPPDPGADNFAVGISVAPAVNPGGMP